MAQLRDVRDRIQSVKNTQQVTRAMKMVAAAKLRKSQAAALDGRPYSDNLLKIIQSILDTDKIPAHPLLEPGKGQKQHLIVLSGDLGLCGGFNLNIIEKTEALLAENPDNTDMTILGNKAFQYFDSRNASILNHYQDLDEIDKLALSKELADSIITLFRSQKYRWIKIVYTEFVSAITQNVSVDTVLPFSLPRRIKESLPLEMIYHPSPESIFNSLLPRFIQSRFHHAILESLASIHGARMSSMDMATRNAGDLIDELTLQYNQARQSAITRELIEIISGADALNSS